MKTYRIYPLKLGTSIRDSSAVAYQQNPGTQREQPIISYYVTDGSRKVLVDTGGDPADGVKHMPYYQDEDDFLPIRLGALNVKPEEIDTVILTHLHWDHCSNNDLFPNATFYVQREELRYAAAPLAIQKKLYDQQVIFKTDYVILNGCADILDGIRVIPTPGHSPGSQSVLIQTEKGIYALTGDLVTVFDCWEANPRIVNGLHTDMIRYYESFDYLEKSCDHILPGHEIGVFRQPCYP